MNTGLVDSHQHFWQVGRFDYPWMSPSVEVLYQDYLPSQLEPILQENGVSRTVLVQASNSVDESHWMLALAGANQFIAGVVGWVDLISPRVDEQLVELTAHPKFKGVRHLVESEPKDDWLVQPEVLRGLNRLSAHRLSYDLLVHTRHLKHVPEVADRCPELALVIDHMAKPPIASAEIKTWCKALKPVADYKNVHCKLSGLVTEASRSSWQTDDLRPYVESALDLFGPKRMMFGSDYPVCLLASSYQRVLQSFQEILHDLPAPDRERIFATNATEFYRLN
ncbi:MAG TPA: amidohydrolase family protein [Pyrinomonadaceae bacterium]|jgi:Predicted metal-dependent hydrolase of the TIM-barrel fold|nr:amidohydrolase family protein [Pyrinomonadaceae bacterium]